MYWQNKQTNRIQWRVQPKMYTCINAEHTAKVQHCDAGGKEQTSQQIVLKQQILYGDKSEPRFLLILSLLFI